MSQVHSVTDDNGLSESIHFDRYQNFVSSNNYSFIPRFDAADTESDTNELEYSVTQRLFLRHLHPAPCSSGALPPALNGIVTVPATYTECGGDTSEWITWKLTAKYFFDPYFGAAASALRRNVLTATLDLTGVAFLNGPRNDSPVVSRLKIRTSNHIDLEWDADYVDLRHRKRAWPRQEVSPTCQVDTNSHFVKLDANASRRGRSRARCPSSSRTHTRLA